MKVGEIMTRHVEFIEPGAPVQEAATLMGELDVGALPVGSPDALRGVITDRDIIYRVVAQGLSNAEAKVADAMSSTVFSCREDDTVEAVLDLMGSRHVRRVPVLSTSDRVVGWVTLSDISRRLMHDSGVVRAALDAMAAEDAPAAA